LISPLKKFKVGIETNSNGAWITIKGPAQLSNVTNVEIDCKESTQFASAMMLAFSDLSLQFDLKNIHASETYIDMSKFILQATQIKNSYFVPVDFSSLSYPLALGLIRGKVLIKNCHALDPLQADSKFIELVQKAGGDIEWVKDGLKATSKNTMAPIQVNGADFPDLVPTLAFMAAHIEGESVLTNLAVLHHKESDRVEELMNLLKNMDVNFKYIKEKEEIRIHGKKEKYKAATLTPARDHRMVMTSYLFLRANNGGTLSEVDCVNKSFPNFFELMK
jgi:3-phosphoshikimate 1-carboxyvinyltransferase